MLPGENVIKSPSLERIINIYGSNDVGHYSAETNIPSIPKIYTHAANAFETINIELKDISHLEYFYKNGDNPPLKQIRASNFIARVTQASLNVDQLEGFLRQFAPTPTIQTYLDPNTNKIQTVRTYMVDLENLSNV